MNINFDNDRPIYLQIVELMENDIISGKISPGEKLLSVRDFANEFKVNPNTICRALSELEDLKLIYTDSTNGKYVTEDIKLIKKLKSKYGVIKAKEYLKDMNDLEFNYDEAMSYLKDLGGE